MYLNGRNGRLEHPWRILEILSTLLRPPSFFCSLAGGLSVTHSHNVDTSLRPIDSNHSFLMVLSMVVGFFSSALFEPFTPSFFLQAMLEDTQTRAGLLVDPLPSALAARPLFFILMMGETNESPGNNPRNAYPLLAVLSTHILQCMLRGMTMAAFVRRRMYSRNRRLLPLEWPSRGPLPQQPAQALIIS